jgi:sulfite reductase (NADPH) flavoprotein alpha-component
MPETPAPAYDKNNPFPACITERRRLTSTKGQKETVHFTINIAGSGLTYNCGDSLGVFSKNNPVAVEALLKANGFSGEEEVVLPRTETKTTLRKALTDQFVLSGPAKKFIQLVHDRVTNPTEKETLAAVLNNPDAVAQKAWLDNREFIDIAEEFPSARFSAQEYIENLRRLTPRLYSIASAPAQHPQEIQLTIAVVRYETNGRKREGVCSTFLSSRAPLNKAEVPVFVAAAHFGPPEDDSTPMIMVGPGTGIAPFRSFLQDRAARATKGKNWLFFGDQHRESDFLYEDELTEYLQQGVLTELSTAWSRDQEYKIYVQDRMRERGADLWQWLQSGAYFYVCGDAKRMAKDVDAALHEIIATHGKMTPEAAAEYVKQLKKDKRYQRDVY